MYFYQSCKLLLLLFLLQDTHTTDYYYYADLRWDNVAHYKTHPSTIPHNHGLRLLPALHVALDKLRVLSLYSASPRVNGYLTENLFYRSSSEFLAACKPVNGSERGKTTPSDTGYTTPCFLHANYDIGYCSELEIEPSTLTDTTYHCKNNPRQDHVLSFQTGGTFFNISLLSPDSNIHIVLPDGTGLSEPHLARFNNTFGAGNLPESLSLQQLHERIEFVSGLLGRRFVGIVASTDNAYLTALISMKLGVPNFVPSVTDSTGMWPVKSDVNYESGILANSLVLGYEDWMILDMITYIISEAGWEGGTMQILHESGHSERLAYSIRTNLREELEKRGNGEIRITEDMYLDRISFWDYYLSERGTLQQVHRLLDLVPSRTRVIFLLGKENFIRNMLLELHARKMYKRKLSRDQKRLDPDKTRDLIEDNTEQSEQFGIVIIPENGAPCGDMIRPYKSGSDDSEADNGGSDGLENENVITEVLHGAFLICHNAHNRASWKYRSPSTMSRDGTDNENMYRWKLDPPSMNTETRYEPGMGSESYERNRRYLVREEEVNMERWNLFENEFREKASSVLGFQYPDNQEVSGLAGFVHDSLIWGMFTTLLNTTHPNLFSTNSGMYTLNNLYGDGGSVPSTDTHVTADITRIGWPGMFGTEFAPVSQYNKTHMMRNTTFLVNDGPWHDIVNRYTFKDNRPFGSVPHTIKIFDNGKWKRWAGLLPHRRKVERDKTINYQQDAEKLSTEVHTDSNGNSLETGAPFYDKYKYIRYSRDDESYIHAEETMCGYDYHICYWKRRREWIITIATSGPIGLILIGAPLFYFFLKWWIFNSKVNAMKWRLNDYAVSYHYQRLNDHVDSDKNSPNAGNIPQTRPEPGYPAYRRRSSLPGRKGEYQRNSGVTNLKLRTNSIVPGYEEHRSSRRISFAVPPLLLGEFGSFAHRQSEHAVSGRRRHSVLQHSISDEKTSLLSVSDVEVEETDYVYTDIAVYNEKEWGVKELSSAAGNIVLGKSWRFKIEMKEMLEMKQRNITKLCGVVYNHDLQCYMLLSQHCKRGSLQDLLENKDITLDIDIRLNLICDIIHGIEYLHNHTNIGSHGYLKSSNVLVTGCFTAKIADFGTLSRISDTEKLEGLSKTSAESKYLWTAPEILRENSNSTTVSVLGTKEGDVYSFGIICHEILECSGPYNIALNEMQPSDVLKLVKQTTKTPYRPVYMVNTKRTTRELTAVTMTMRCWEEDPGERPCFRRLVKSTVPRISNIRTTVVEHILTTVKKYSRKKEKKLLQMEEILRTEKSKVNKIQRLLMPWEVLENIAAGVHSGIESLLSSSIMCLEITGAEELLDSCPASDVWKALQDIRDEIFDFVRYHPDLFCVISTESVYVIIGNGTRQSGVCLAATLRELYIDLTSLVKTGFAKGRLRVKAGMDSGTVETGIVGERIPTYQILHGPVYRIADIMRCNAEPGVLLVSENSKKQMKSTKFKETGVYRYQPSVGTDRLGLSGN